MNLLDYLEKKKKRECEEVSYRVMCPVCRQPGFSCYCNLIESFDPRIEFAILIHPLEARRRLATGRMAHLCLKNSHLIEGHNYSEDSRVNDLIARTDAQKVILYPGREAIDLSVSGDQLNELFPYNQKLIVFVIDGTWATARQTMNVSQNLKDLPKVCFVPTTPSQFRVRRQPKPQCYSTIEAIHHLIDLFGGSRGFEVDSRAHDRLLKVFQSLVEQQVQLIDQASNPRRPSGKPRWRTRSRRGDNHV